MYTQGKIWIVKPAWKQLLVGWKGEMGKMLGKIFHEARLGLGFGFGDGQILNKLLLSTNISSLYKKNQ